MIGFIDLIMYEGVSYTLFEGGLRISIHFGVFSGAIPSPPRWAVESTTSSLYFKDLMHLTRGMQMLHGGYHNSRWYYLILCV